MRFWIKYFSKEFNEVIFKTIVLNNYFVFYFMLQLGIDDAGRGPVIGPMVLAGCLIDKKDESKLKNLGVKDSKQLTSQKREFLAEKIKKIAKQFELIIIYPKEIDENVNKNIKLNETEALACAKIINKINKYKEKINVVLDCPSVNTDSWQSFLVKYVSNNNNLKISCEHKADANHVVVGAASILAKSLREKEMQKLKKEFGEQVGSGYTSDVVTQKFVQKYALKYKDKNIFRTSWKTWKNAVDDLGQKKLFN